MPEIYKLGFEALDLRYLYISSNYRTKLQFSEQSLQGARNARLGLIKKLKTLAKDVSSEGILLDDYVGKFKDALEDNLNMSLAFAILNEMLKSDNKAEDILTTVYDFDRVLALDIRKSVEESSEKIPSEVEELLEMRKVARENKDYNQSDLLRNKILELGYTVLDSCEGQKVEKI
jgi:cysteinyl-tRNA synthetase